MTVAEPATQSQTASVVVSPPIIAFRWRILALLVDFFVLSLVDSLANVVFGVTHVTSGTIAPLASGNIAMYTTTTDVGWPWLAAITLVYFTGLELLFGATPGKWLSGLRVTDRSGRLPNPLAILARNLLRLVDWLPFLYVAGGVFALASPQRQRLGDRLASTVVVTRESLAEPPLSHGQLRWRLALLGTIGVALLAFCGGFFYYGRPPLVVQSAVNTDAFTFPDGVRSYALGAPHWGKGTISYPIRYVTQTNRRSCHGTLTLRWQGFPGGWQLAQATTTCP